MSVNVNVIGNTKLAITPTNAAAKVPNKYKITIDFIFVSCPSLCCANALNTIKNTNNGAIAFNALTNTVPIVPTATA